MRYDCIMLSSICTYTTLVFVDLKVNQQRATPQQNSSLVSKAMDFVFGW